MVVKPDVHVSTADAFANIKPKSSTPAIAEIILSYPVANWKELLKNDFEESVFRKHPSIKLIKEKMYSLGAAYATMSGTGSAVVGIFDHEVKLSDQFPGTTFWSGSPDGVKD